MMMVGDVMNNIIFDSNHEDDNMAYLTFTRQVNKTERYFFFQSIFIVVTNTPNKNLELKQNVVTT